jgi:RNA 3'-terminal phosphate cyclase (ATP)
MLTLDGSFGEGGGQILRTSLSLSLVSGRPFRIVNVRAGRSRPGLGRQHLAAVRAAAEIGSARVTGDSVGSPDLTFRPAAPTAGDYTFDIGTAGSTTLVLQTVLPALITLPERSSLVLRGGTHNPFAPPFDFVSLAFLPLLQRMGSRVAVGMKRPGFYPAGGGEIGVTIEPGAALSGLDIPERGEIEKIGARAMVSKLPVHIAEREVKTVAKKLSLENDALEIEDVPNPAGPGNVVMVEVRSRHVTEMFTGFGRRGVPAEKVAGDVARSALRYIKANVPVGEHLADQLLVPMALAGKGSFRAFGPTSHTMTNAEVIQRFLDVVVEIRPCGKRECEIGVSRA